jgi:hypothetical protein
MCQTKEKAMADDQNKSPEGDNKDMVSKADLDAAIARNEKLEKDLEDVRMEVLTPEYQKFLDALEKSGDDDTKPKDEKKQTPEGDDAFEKMTKKQLFDLAVKTARDEISGSLTKKEQDTKAAEAARTKREIASFAKEHDDFETFRPIMYGLSLDPKNADKSLSQLYDAAKAHVKAIHKEPDEEEKSRQRRSSNEKPGSDSSSLEKLSKMSREEISKEAAKEVREKLGPIPIE